MRPPAGFWALNSFAVTCDEGRPVDIVRVAPKSANTFDGRDILSDLMSIDDSYYSMPLTTDRAEIVFDSPRQRPGKERTVFLHSRGWYQLHLNNNEPDFDRFTKIMSEPGSAVQFAVEQFTEWR